MRRLMAVLLAILLTVPTLAATKPPTPTRTKVPTAAELGLPAPLTDAQQQQIRGKGAAVQIWRDGQQTVQGAPPPVKTAATVVLAGVVAGVAIYEGGTVVYKAVNNKPKQDKQLSNGEIKKLKEGGVDPEELKRDVTGSRNTGPIDLYKDKKGNIVVKPKGGKGPGEPTGHNINDF